MGPHIRLTAAVLVPLLGFGCVGQRREVRLHADGAPQVVHVPESGGQPIEIPEAELWGAFREAGRHVVAQADPLAAAQETFGLAERSGTYLYYVRTGRLVAESLDDGLVEAEGSDEAVTRGYLEWCGGTKLGPGDCLRLLSHSKVLTPHRRYVVALVMALALSFGPMFDSLAGLADPNMVAVTLASAASMYLLLLVVPEPLSKAIAIGLTVTLIGYIGLDLFWSLVHGWKALVSAVDQAKNFGDMWLAARDFGHVLGPQIGQLLMLLVSRSLGKGIAAPGKPLPRFSEASAQAKKLLRVRLAAATAVRTVTLGSGVITISLASSAMAVTTPSSKTTGGPVSGARGDGSTPSPALKGSPYHPEAVAERVRPPYRPNPQHNPRATQGTFRTPEPPDAAAVYGTARRAGIGEWFGKGKGGWYRYSSDNTGSAHFSGIVPEELVPIQIRRGR